MDIKDRIFGWTAFSYLLFLLFAGYCTFNLVKIQFFDKDLKKSKDKVDNQILEKKVANRGDIISSDNKTLSAYLPTYALVSDFGIPYFKGKTIVSSRVNIDKKDKSKNISFDSVSVNRYKELASALSKFVGDNSSNTYYQMLYNNRINAETSNDKAYVRRIVDKDITIIQKDSIFEIPSLRNKSKYRTGIYVEEKGKRIYPYDDFARSTIGVVRDNGRFVSGIEKNYNEYLNNRSNIISTIDTRMQDICETALRNKLQRSGDVFEAGTIVLMETATGDIKAIVNIGQSGTAYKPTAKDIYNNAVQATTDPGSTFKIVSLMVSLETGKVKITDKIDCDEGSSVVNGKKLWNEVVEVENDSFGEQTISEIIEKSLNIGTAKMVEKAFNRDGKDYIKAIKKIGIMDTIGGLSEASPFILTPSANTWNRNSIYHISHGYQMRLAPIHVLSFFNAIANNGVMVKPRTVKGIKHNTGKEVLFESEIINPSICSEATLKAVRQVLSGVVSPKGTARRIAGSQYGIAGKTGTAQMFDQGGYVTTSGAKRNQASFCGYFPEKNPQYTCIVVLYSKRLSERDHVSASTDAAPLFREVSDKVYVLDKRNQKTLNLENRKYTPEFKNASSKNITLISKELNIPLNITNGNWIQVLKDTATNEIKTEEIAIQNKIVPDVIGMGLKDAMYILENMGLRVSHNGLGTVTKQSLKQGESCTTGQRIALELAP